MRVSCIGSFRLNHDSRYLRSSVVEKVDTSAGLLVDRMRGASLTGVLRGGKNWYMWGDTQIYLLNFSSLRLG